MNVTKVLGARILTAAALATAFALAPAAANAQVAFGVRIGRPAYVPVVPRYPVAPVVIDPYHRDFYRHDVYVRDGGWGRGYDHHDFGRGHFDGYRR